MGVIKEIQEDLEAGARRLFSEYHSRLLAEARSLCSDSDSAEDLVMLTLETYFAKPEKFDPSKSELITWLKAVMRNHFRKSLRRKSHIDTIFLSADDLQAVADRLQAGESWPEPEGTESDELIRRAIASLSPKVRDAVILHYFKGRSVEKTASALGISVEAAKNRLFCARQILHTRLKSRLGKALAVLGAILLGATALFGAYQAGLIDAFSSSPVVGAGVLVRPQSADNDSEERFDLTQETQIQQAHESTKQENPTMKLTKTFATAAAVAGLAVGVTAAEPSIARANFRNVALMEVPGYTANETLQDFPVLARLGVSTVPRFSYAECNPNTMRFFLSDGTVLAHEVDTWNPDGESLVWVRFPKLEKDCVAYLGWNPEDASAVPAVSSADVWSAYDLVWHLNEGLLDATGKGVALTPINAPTAVVEGGILGRHYVNDAANQGLVSPANISTDILPKGSLFTVSAWFRTSYEASAGRLISNKVGDKTTDGFECVVWTTNNNKLFYRGKQTSGGDHYTPNTLTKNVWSYTACSFTGSTTALALLNGDNVKSTIGCVSERNSGSPYVFGNNAASLVNNGHIGDYDELRISPGHSQIWLETEYATVANDRTFCTFTTSGNPLARLDVRAYGKTSEVSVSNASTQVLFNFPVLLRVSGERVSGLRTRQIGEEGYGLAFGTEDNTLLHYEVDTWNPDGESLVWVCLNEFRPGLNTFKMYWRKSRQPVSVNRPELVWGKYAGVWHLNNPDEDGVTVDSTGLGLKTRLTTNSLPIVVADNGFLGRGMRNTDVYQGVKIDPLPAHVFPAAISVSAWFKPSTGSSGVRRLVSAQGVDEQQVSYLETFELQVANGTLGYRPKFEVNAQGQKIGDPYLKQPELQNYTQGVWHRFTVQTRFNGSGSLWIDDTRLGYWAESTWLQPTAANCAIGFAMKGGINEDDGLSFLGEYDELRISGRMSDDWLSQEYRSIADADFAVFSPVENTPWNKGMLVIIY